MRGAEALDLLDVWATGHPGGCGTCHATTADGALLRLDRLAQRNNVPPQTALIAEAIHLVAVIAGGNHGRRVVDVARVHGLDALSDASCSTISPLTGAGNESMVLSRNRRRSNCSTGEASVVRSGSTPSVGGVVMAVLAVAVLTPAVAYAAGAGAGAVMPWTGPLQALLDNLSGPTARIVAGLGFVIGGGIWAFSRSEEGAKRFGQIVIGAAIAIGAANIVTSLAFVGAVI